MCVNPGDICTRLVSLMGCARSIPSDENPFSYMEILPLEILEKIIDFLDYKTISRLRSVNSTWNSICARYLNKAFFKTKKDIENYIFVSYEELKVDGKAPSEMLQDYYRNDNMYGCNHFRPTIQKILFANKILLMLIILYQRIFRYMYYRNFRNSTDDFIFIYGNAIDWAIERLSYLQSHDVTVMDTFSLKPPAKATKHLDKVIAFYRKKTGLSKIGLEKYLEVNCKWHIEASYEHCVQLNVSKVELSFLCNTLLQFTN